MKVYFKTPKGYLFDMEVSAEDTVAVVKKNIEAVRGSRVYLASWQMLVYQGRVFKDDTTLSENNVADNSFILIMLTKSERSEGEENSNKPSSKTSRRTPTSSAVQQATVSLIAPPDPAPVGTSSSGSEACSVASKQATGCNLEETVLQIIDMGGGAWDRGIVIQALDAALNDPELAVEYLYSGLRSSIASGGGSLGFLRNSHQFQALPAMVQANPETLQPMLQEFGKRNPNLMKLIEEHHDEFVQLVNKPLEDGREGFYGVGQHVMTPQEIQVTPKERDAIVRLEAMGFDGAVVLEVFFACNKNEVLAANYLVDHVDEFY